MAIFIQIGIIVISALATVAFYIYVVFLILKYLFLGFGYILCCKCLDLCDKPGHAAENKRRSLENIKKIMQQDSDAELSSY